MRLRLCDVSHHLTNCRTRIPFRFGINTMTAAPLCVCRVLMETESGERAEGFSSDLLVPKWFQKNPDQSIEGDWRQLCDSAQAAANVAVAERDLATVYQHWRRVYDDRVHSAPAGSTDVLVRGQGVSMIERAIMDAACRLAKVSFIDGLQRDLFGTSADARLARTIASLTAPRSSIAVRHTVGLVDALDDDDLPRDQRINDELPETLAEDIAAFGLVHFKLKVGGDIGADLARLNDIARIVRAQAASAPVFTLDGNEQYQSISQFAELLARLGDTENGAWLRDHLAYIEQPLPRGRTFDDDANAGMDDLGWPVIIDEADFTESSFLDAVNLGYRGVSVKNCKGVFRALLNRAVCDDRGSGYFQSGEDLTNLPIIALQQDLVTAATLGLSHVERNGHHYFRGLNHLPAAEQREAVTLHADLYEESSHGAALRIRDGSLSIGSLLACTGYGFDVLPNLHDRIAMKNWQPESVLT